MQNFGLDRPIAALYPGPRPVWLLEFAMLWKISGLSGILIN